jgi:SSS family solute:Na+ symporter
VLTLDVYQAVFLLLTQAAVVIMSVKQAGGLAGLLAIKDLGDAGTPLPSLIPPSDWNLNTQTFFPLPAVVAWATVAGLSWLACNFGMAQRLLAARTERDAQKGLLLLGVLVTAVCFGAYAIGVSVRHLKPDLGPDQAFMHVMLTMFPAGVRGLLLAGMMAALLSTVDGLLTASSALFTEDIYRRFLRRAAGGNELKQVTRILEVLALLAAMSLLPTMRQSKSAMGFVQDFYGNVLGVVVALYLVGMFSKRATGRAAFISMITGIALAFFLNPPRNSAFLQAILPESLLNHPFQMNFAYVGFVTFVYGIVATLALSRLEPPIPLDKLTNLTIHTLPDVRGPWVGLKAWPNLWKWALLLAGGWFGFCVAWELIVRTR